MLQVEIFTESGGSLEVHVTVEGPFVKAWGNVPEPTAHTKVLLDKIVANKRSGVSAIAAFKAIASKVTSGKISLPEKTTPHRPGTDAFDDSFYFFIPVRRAAGTQFTLLGMGQTEY